MKYVTINGKKVLEDIKREAQNNQNFINYTHMLNAFKLTPDEVLEALKQLQDEDFIKINETMKILEYKNLDAQYKIVTPEYLKEHKENIKQLKDKYCPFIKPEIIENYPYNITQHNYLKDIQKTLDNLKTDKKYVLIESNDYEGQPIITSSIAQIINDTYIITNRKTQQYKNIARFKQYKNRSQFNCMESGILDIQDGHLKTCAQGQCLEEVDIIPIDDEIFECKYNITDDELLHDPDIVCCPYINHKQKIGETTITLLNYNDAFDELNDGIFEKRKLIILDDAHQIEKHLMNRIEFKISKKDLKRDLAYHMDNTKLSMEDAILKVEELLNLYNRAYQSERKYDTKRKLEKIIQTLKDNPENWVCIQDDEYLQFKPITINEYIDEYLTGHADKIILTSHNIQSRELLLKWLNIDKDDVSFIKLNARNPKARRPIVMNLVGAMSKNKRNKTKPKTKPVINNIILSHPESKGIIYTADKDLEDFIKNEIPNQRFIFDTQDNHENIIKTFNTSDKPVILITSNLEYDDISYDKVGFQVVYKIPYPILKEESVKQRKSMEEEWYIYQAINNLSELYMKGYENKDDICTTYILDSGIKTILDNKKYITLIPEFIKDEIEK